MDEPPVPRRPVWWFQLAPHGALLEVVEGVRTRAEGVHPHRGDPDLLLIDERGEKKKRIAQRDRIL